VDPLLPDVEEEAADEDKVAGGFGLVASKVAATEALEVLEAGAEPVEAPLGAGFGCAVGIRVVRDADEIFTAFCSLLLRGRTRPASIVANPSIKL
jgi:hypothetical protein